MTVYRWLVLVCALFAFPALAAPTFPTRAKEPVVDAANILPADRKAALDAKLTAFEKSTGQQVVVATIPDLQGYDIADYGYQLGRAWGIGTKERDDGVLLIVAPNERRMRIEVGYGLEPVLTDAYSSLIINETMRPKFKAGDMPGGIEAGVDAILQQVQLPPEEAAKRAAAAQAKARDARDDVDPGAFIFWIMIFFFVILPILGAFSRGRRGRRHSSGIGEALLWTAINVAANSGDNDGGGWGGGGGFGGGGGGGFSGGGGGFGGGGASGGW